MVEPKARSTVPRVMWPRGPLPVSNGTQFHAQMLFPQNEQDEDGRELLVASALSPVFALDAHDGSLVLEVPEDHREYEYETGYLKVWVSRKSINALGKVTKACVPFTLKKSEADSGFARSFYTADDFSKSAAGTKNLTRYLCQMRKDYERHFKKIVDSKGSLLLRHDIDCTWEEPLARSSSYFRRYLRGTSYWKGMSKLQQEMT